MTKLTAVQIAVLEDMVKGWTLRSTQGFEASAWLTHPITTQHRTVRLDTLWVLTRNKHVEIAESKWPFTTYRLCPTSN